MRARSAVVVGYDAVSPLGTSLDGQWQRALEGRSGIGPLTRFPLRPDFPVRIAGQVPDLEEKGYPFLSARQQAAWTSPIFTYALLTAVRAWERSGIQMDAAIARRTAVTYSSAIGGIDAVLHADRRLQTENRLPPPYANPNSCLNMVGGKIAIETGAQGPICSPVAACATGLTSIIIGAMFIAQGRADVAVCGAADFAVVEPIAAGFHTMNGTYHPKEGCEHGPPETASRPFSLDRRGFVMAEGAGAVIIAAEEFAQAHGLRPSARLAGWGMTSDAHHFVAPYLETVRQCMTDAIADAGLALAEISAVNAHAASTKVGDKVEYEALRAVFGDRLPPVSANKSLFGHAMGASSVLETIFALKGMADSALPPTINYRPDPEIEIDCVAEGRRALEQEYVLKNSFGFGGCNACAVLQKLL